MRKGRHTYDWTIMGVEVNHVLKLLSLLNCLHEVYANK